MNVMYFAMIALFYRKLFLIEPIKPKDKKDV